MPQGSGKEPRSYMPPGATKEGKKKRTSTVDHNLGGPVVENLPANAGDTGLIPGPGRSHMPQDH